MATKQVVGGLESMARVYNIRKIFARKTNSGAKVHHVSATGPVPESDGYSVRIILFKLIDIRSILDNIRPELFPVRRVQVWYGIQGGEQEEINIAVKCRP